MALADISATIRAACRAGLSRKSLSSLVEMGKRERQGWIIFGGTIAMVLGGAVAFVVLPHPRVTYCTEGFGTCVTNRYGTWRVLETLCPAAQSPRFVSWKLVSIEIRRCHSIPVSGFSAPLDACPAACAK
jgi:hypothetical protein